MFYILVLLFCCLLCKTNLQSNFLLDLQGSTEAELKKSYEDSKKWIDERDAIIVDLKLKIDSMEKAYENVLKVCFI